MMNARVWKIAPLLFGSGFCSLVYQTAWQRELRLIFGASTAASAAVLAIFMGGLGLGGALLGGRVDKEKRPLAFYANLELLISLSAALTPLLVMLARTVYTGLGGSVTMGLGLGSVVRLVLSALVLAVPTLLMGGTLPAVARAAETAEDVRRRAVAVLYGVNTLGAVAGAAASTFLLFEVFGTRSTLWLAALVNVLVALVARTVDRSLPGHEVSTASADAQASSPATALPPRRFVLGAAALVGFAFFLMEMVWYRMLGPLLGGSTFTFGLILVVALAGIGLGGAAYAAWGQQRPATLHGFALTCLLEAVLLAVPLALGDRVAVLAAVVRPLSVFGFSGLVLSWAVIAVLVVLPAAFVSGVQFPLLLALLGRGGDDVGRQVGQAYAWNTVGSIVGSLAGGFGLLPLLSAPGVWRLVGAVLVGLGLVAVVLSLRQETPSPARLVPPLASAAVATLLLTATGPTAVWRHSAIGAGRATVEFTSHNGLKDWASGTRHWLLWETDGVESSVGVMGAYGLSFMVNGKSDGNSIGDAGTQVMGGLLGALAHPHPRRSLVVGLGTGSTAGWLGSVPEMERVDAVEIEPAILRFARQCDPVNEKVLDNPKVKVHLDDAREVLLASKDSYDIIFSEPSNPYRAGISSLFSREFYQAVKRRLAPGGIFLQWLQTYEVDSRTVRSVYATLASEFGSVETWRTQGGDLILMATEMPLRHDLERMRARVSQEPYRRALPWVWGTNELEGVLSHFIAGPAVSRALAEGQEALVNTDDLSYVEFAFARSVGHRESGFSHSQLRRAAWERKAERPEVQRGTADWQRVEELRMMGGDAPVVGTGAGLDEAALKRRQAFNEALKDNNARQALRLWREGGWQPRGPSELTAVGSLLAVTGDEVALQPLLEQLRGMKPFDAEALLARLRLQQGRLADAAQSLERAFALLHQTPWHNRVVFQDALSVGMELAEKDAALGQRMWVALEKPFLNNVGESLRLSTRLVLGTLLESGKRCAEALAAFEPHVPWNQKFLETRSRCYVNTQHPLQDQALEDYLEFMRAEPPPLWDDAPGSAPAGAAPPSAPPVSDVGSP
ncbi:MAG TPA: fused MFS/spermidine synthase [Archangium sp.]|uniref:fused MFS/spermidine synthase n=1 Tax=Archangium sp. TaxID=1872627 RepID=UPI002E370F58|nr:fused MFS/spermidine synthase [Archangium sp.]HEX5745816.1 fused MFS/spermidine synthase [Archangium sp.]